MRIFFLLPILVITNLTITWAQPNDSSILTKVDIPPLFEGCDDPLISEEQRQACSVPKIQAFINQNIVYPDSARSHQIEGVVVVRFSVTEKGAITDLELIRNIGFGCGQEAMRVIRMMPVFRPALRNGLPVATQMTLPIRFKKIDEAAADNKNLYQIHWGTAYQNKLTKEKLKELLKRHLIVRDYYGNTYDINYLTLLIESNTKEIEIETRGNNLSKEMLRALKKVRLGQAITFKVLIQKNYQDIEVSRALTIVK
ncbi:energy transducer TonB [Aureispira anguillae]|uniref:Energy transducer TonB n=1 Tax=Aureispira anguillae TaxID=2864201 RepID=A0A916DVL1_9BACT|nr:energy transducer TonB [Aureispira anguillae]BDS13842.1 energy transducer TonB [Aureispira anguillae]